jgi:hypothetical protein
VEGYHGKVSRAANMLSTDFTQWKDLTCLSVDPEASRVKLAFESLVKLLSYDMTNCSTAQAQTEIAVFFSKVRHEYSGLRVADTSF